MTVRELIERECGPEAEIFIEATEDWKPLGYYNEVQLTTKIRRKPKPVTRPFASVDEALPYVGRLVLYGRGANIVGALGIDSRDAATKQTIGLTVNGVHVHQGHLRDMGTFLNGPEKGQPVGITEAEEAPE